MTDELVTWLRQEFDADERQANNLDELGGWERAGIESTAGGHVVDYLDRFTSARMLAEVDAKRQRIEHYLKVRDFADPAKHPDQAYVLAEGALERSLMLDALPYADRPGYRDEWRP